MGNCHSASAEQLDPISAEERVKVFTVAELKKATNDFRKEMVIGDSFGSHVRGYINPKTLSPAKEGVGMAVAVKRCYMFKDLDQDLQDWLVSSYDFLVSDDKHIFIIDKQNNQVLERNKNRKNTLIN